MSDDYAETLKKLDAEFEALQFDRFGFEEAWAIGNDLVQTGLREKLGIAIDVTVNGQTLFHAGLPGSSPDNDHWIERKVHVVQRFHKSSLFIATQLRQKGKTMEEEYAIPSAEFAASGGAVPIRVRGVGVIGAVTVSGLRDYEDHDMAAAAIRRSINSSVSTHRGQ